MRLIEVHASLTRTLTKKKVIDLESVDSTLFRKETATNLVTQAL